MRYAVRAREMIFGCDLLWITKPDMLGTRNLGDEFDRAEFDSRMDAELASWELPKSLRELTNFECVEVG